MQTDQKDMVEARTIDSLSKLLGASTLHPQAGIYDLSCSTAAAAAVRFGFYVVIIFKDEDRCCRCCGRRYYDFSGASMVFLEPGVTFSMDQSRALPSEGTLLAFSRDLLSCTPLGSHFSGYTFFSYRKEEALHLSFREEETARKCLEDIEKELHHDIDSHSLTLLSRLIELLLDYCSRFYERQFITREDKNKTIIGKLDKMLEGCIEDGSLASEGFPDEGYCASRLNLSTAYFRDLLSFETGHDYPGYCAMKQFASARDLLLSTSLSPSAISSRLGYGSVSQLSCIFKKLTGYAPSQYRHSRN